MPVDPAPPPYIYEGLDPVVETVSPIDAFISAVKSAAEQVSDAADAASQPGMPLSVLRNIAREAPLGSLLCAFLLGVAFSRRR